MTEFHPHETYLAQLHCALRLTLEIENSGTLSRAHMASKVVSLSLPVLASVIWYSQDLGSVISFKQNHHASIIVTFDLDVDTVSIKRMYSSCYRSF